MMHMNSCLCFFFYYLVKHIGVVLTSLIQRRFAFFDVVSTSIIRRCSRSIIRRCFKVDYPTSTRFAFSSLFRRHLNVAGRGRINVSTTSIGLLGYKADCGNYRPKQCLLFQLKPNVLKN